MSGDSNSAVGKLMDRIFPIMPDFFRMMCEQSDVAVQSTATFLQFMETGSEEYLNEIRRLEKQADELKNRNIDALYKAFATPMDREDILGAIQSLDYVINYTKITAREMGALDFDSDKYILEMAVLLKEGVEALQRGYAKLGSNPALADEDATFARKAERNTEKVYRVALSELFRADDHIAALRQEAPGAQAEAFIHIMTVLKRREIYRHLSNSADRLEHAAGILHDIIVQIA